MDIVSVSMNRLQKMLEKTSVENKIKIILFQCDEKLLLEPLISA